MLLQGLEEHSRSDLRNAGTAGLRVDHGEPAVPHDRDGGGRRHHHDSAEEHDESEAVLLDGDGRGGFERSHEDCHAKYRTESHSDIVPRFNERFILSLSNCATCMVLDVVMPPLSPLGRAEHPPDQQEDSEHRAGAGLAVRGGRGGDALAARAGGLSSISERGAGREDEGRAREVAAAGELGGAAQSDEGVSHGGPGDGCLQAAGRAHAEDAADHALADGSARSRRNGWRG